MPIESNFPRWLMRALTVHFGIETFVETGTLEGHTAAIAAEIVAKVHTIEINERMYQQALPEVKSNSRIVRHLGSSVEVIPKIIPLLTGPAMFYLDGHWSGIGPRMGTECPLLDELQLLANRKRDVVVIDDARLFIKPPPPPHHANEWPRIDSVVSAARGECGRHVVRFIDTIIASPEPLTEWL